MTRSKNIKEAVEGLKEQGFPVYVGQWMPCPMCKIPWKFHKANKKEGGKPAILMCPTFPVDTLTHENEDLLEH